MPTSQVQLFPYMVWWSEDKAVLRRNLAEVQGVAAGLIGGIETDLCE